MSTIQVKPAPSLDPRAWPLLTHPVSGGLLDASGQVPADGRPWLYDGITCRLLTEGAIVRAEDTSAPGFTTWASEQLAGQQAADEPAHDAAPEPHDPDPAR